MRGTLLEAEWGLLAMSGRRSQKVPGTQRSGQRSARLTLLALEGGVDYHVPGTFACRLSRIFEVC